MKVKETFITSDYEILANDHYAAIPYDCSNLAADSEGVVKAGTIVPANDATAKGVLLYDVKKNNNPNGAIVVHGAIKLDKLPAVPASTACTALKQVAFVSADGTYNPTFTVKYDANGGTGTATDSSSPYALGSTVTTKANNTFTAPGSKTFSKWNTKADGTGTDYAAGATFVIGANVTLYAIWA